MHACVCALFKTNLMARITHLSNHVSSLLYIGTRYYNTCIVCYDFSRLNKGLMRELKNYLIEMMDSAAFLDAVPRLEILVFSLNALSFCCTLKLQGILSNHLCKILNCKLRLSC